jgi:SAM-dependent methyltransferase
MTSIRAHNEKAAATWGAGGIAYDRVSDTIADAIDHVVARVSPLPSDSCLDVATGTGWTARRIKGRGAGVIGVDIGAGVIEAAKKLAPEIDFRVGDAEQLDFPDGCFDVVTSTFGVMFVARPVPMRINAPANIVVPGQKSQDIDDVEITGAEPEHPTAAPNLKRDAATAPLDDGE